jgi:hypothetical protein
MSDLPGQFTPRSAISSFLGANPICTKNNTRYRSYVYREVVQYELSKIDRQQCGQPQRQQYEDHASAHASSRLLTLSRRTWQKVLTSPSMAALAAEDAELWAELTTAISSDNGEESQS